MNKQHLGDNLDDFLEEERLQAEAEAAASKRVKNKLSTSHIKRLQTEKNIWLASTRPSGRPHLVPIWFAWYGEAFYVCIQSGSVKASNIAGIPQVSLSLEDGSDVIICEGIVEIIEQPWAGEIAGIFQAKYEWDILSQTEYDQLLKIQPQKWLTWPPDNE